jgi:hypothetical protein
MFKQTVDFRLDFGAPADSKTSLGHYDVFVMRLNTDGSYGWTRRIGGTQFNGDWAEGICLDSSGNIYVTAEFHGNVDFRADWGGGSDSKTSAGVSDVFVTRINADGSYGWTHSMGGSGADYSDGGIVEDGLGHVYVAGTFASPTVNFQADWGAGADQKTNAGNTDAFVTMITAGGSYGGTKWVGGPGTEHARGIAADATGNTYLAGHFQGTVDFRQDFTGGSDQKVSAGYGDVFLLRINLDGSYGWTRRMGGAQQDEGEGVHVSGSDVYVTGAFGGTVNFRQDFGGISDLKSSPSVQGSFVTRVLADGSYSWTKIFAGTATSRALAVTASGSGVVGVTGFFQGTMNFEGDFGGTDSRTTMTPSGQIFASRFRH